MQKLITLTTVGMLIVAASSANADRVQYSLEQATSLSNASNNNMSITFSHKAIRNPNTLTAKDLGDEDNSTTPPSSGGGHTGGIASPGGSSSGGHTGSNASPTTDDRLPTGPEPSPTEKPEDAFPDIDFDNSDEIPL